MSKELWNATLSIAKEFLKIQMLFDKCPELLIMI